MALSQYFDLGIGLKGYEEEGSWDGDGKIWGDMLRMVDCRLSTVSMEVERESVQERGGLSGEEGKARTTREQIKQVHVNFIYNSNDT